MKIMIYLAGFLLAATLSAKARAGEERSIELEIERDFSISADTVTICRVRARNLGSHTVQGSEIGFEAHAIERGQVVARERGRFGGALRPGEAVETLIGFEGRFDSFEVVPAEAGAKGARKRSGRRSSSRGRMRKPKR
jgi:hypothetical protein